MAVSFDNIKAGDELWDCHMERMGNTTMRKMGAWSVLVVSIDHAKRRAVVRWNGNTPKEVDAHYFRKLRRIPAKGTYAREQYDRENPR